MVRKPAAMPSQPPGELVRLSKTTKSTPFPDKKQPVRKIGDVVGYTSPLRDGQHKAVIVGINDDGTLSLDMIIPGKVDGKPFRTVVVDSARIVPYLPASNVCPDIRAAA